MIVVDLGGGTAPHAGATYVVDLHHPVRSPRQDATVTPWTIHLRHETSTGKVYDEIPGELDDGSVDLVWASHFMEHIPKGQPLINVMNEAWRVLKPGGRFHMRLPLVGYTDPLTGDPKSNQIGWQPWADPTHVSYWWMPEALLYFTEGPFKPQADYGISIWDQLNGWTHDPFGHPAGGWCVQDEWEGIAALRKPG